MKDPRNEARTNAEHVAMNDVKGKPRTEGYPVSERTDAFRKGYQSWDSKSGGTVWKPPSQAPGRSEMAWSPKATFPSNWEVGLKKNQRGA